MESYNEELTKKENRFNKALDIVTIVVFAGLVTMGIVFIIMLLRLKP